MHLVIETYKILLTNVTPIVSMKKITFGEKFPSEFL